jgi:2-polyprenyl-3-methyl-5-hydroxy-6-metoxy-1,4-benzoquinol methylase
VVENSRLTDANKDLRFEFGENWLNFIRQNFSEEKLESSRKHMLSLMGVDSLQGLSFLDIGCGSGLHSLAAARSGASPVRSFDYDPKSVEATRYVKEMTGAKGDWNITQGSVLDEAFLATLPRYDVVYSWGVLHHTGDVWRALANTVPLVAPGGLLYIALYAADVQKNPTPEFWLDVKKRYVAAGAFRRRLFEAWYIWRFMLGRSLIKTPLFIWRMLTEKRERGMNMLTDIRDWLGGWPMEFTWDADVVAFCEKAGFTPVQVRTGEACTEFVFRHTAAESA